MRREAIHSPNNAPHPTTQRAGHQRAEPFYQDEKTHQQGNGKPQAGWIDETPAGRRQALRVGSGELDQREHHRWDSDSQYTNCPYQTLGSDTGTGVYSTPRGAYAGEKGEGKIASCAEQHRQRANVVSNKDAVKNAGDEEHKQEQ